MNGIVRLKPDLLVRLSLGAWLFLRGFSTEDHEVNEGQGGSRELGEMAVGVGASPATARIQHGFCGVIDLIARTRKLSGNLPVAGVLRSESHRIL